RLGAAYIITPKGSLLGSCDPVSEMVQLATTSEPRDDCSATFPSAPTPSNTTIAFDLVHASSNKFSDPSWKQLTTDGSGTGVTNTAYYAFQTNSGGNLSLTVSGYTTVPASLAACTAGPPAIPVAGIQLVIYQVAACPAGQSFPTPVVSTSFNGDGIIPISGLAANTSYLMLLDGIENTKALFNITFAGAALPLRIVEFTGMTLSGANRIWWKTELEEHVSGMRLERSADGISFEVLNNAVVRRNGSYDDGDPFTGKNYYRLVVVNDDRSLQYSNVIVLNNRETGTIKIFPVPALKSLNLMMSQQASGHYLVSLHNTLGQPVWQKTIWITSNTALEKLQLDVLPAGLYHLTVYGPTGNIVKSATVTLH
nr:T9SS type A sorting domain-containing protein [Chitinophagaceae bacterium]